MLLHLVSAVIAVLQFSSVFSAGGDPQLAKRGPVTSVPAVYTQCKGGELHTRCQDLIKKTWDNKALQLFTNQHQFTNWDNGCKLTWWTEVDAGQAKMDSDSLGFIISAFDTVKEKCLAPGVAEKPGSVKGYRNVFVGKVKKLEVVLILDGQ